MPWLPLIQVAVNQLDSFLKTTRWRGRENEVVNLFAHRFLAAAVSPAGPLRSIRQVGIEVAVRQVTGTGKQFVRKDLVIWPEDDMTVWTGDGTPAVVIEWKRNDTKASNGDAEWLRLFCAQHPTTLGVAVCAHLDTSNRGCQIIAVYAPGSSTLTTQPTSAP